MWKERLKGKEKYLMEAGNVYIEGSTGNEPRCINSSCKPHAKYVAIGGYDVGTRVLLVATDDIEPKSMIHADRYGWSTGRGSSRQTNLIKVQCQCKITDDCKEGKVFFKYTGKWF